MDWFSVHFYPLETQDVFLVRALKPFCEQYIWPQREARTFFIRYHDERGPHLRIRMRGKTEWMEDMIRPAFKGWFAERGEWEEVAYVSEPERYGGEEALTWAEEHFHISTRVVLDRLGRSQFTYGDGMFDALRMQLMAVHTAALSRAQAKSYFKRLYDQWLPVFLPANDLEAREGIADAFEKALSGQKDRLTATVDGFWRALDGGKFDAGQPEWLRWLRGNELIFKGLENNLEQALPSLIHLNNNRMGINNQDEVYLLFILSETL